MPKIFHGPHKNPPASSSTYLNYGPLNFSKFMQGLKNLWSVLHPPNTPACGGVPCNSVGAPCARRCPTKYYFFICYAVADGHIDNVQGLASF